MNYSSGLYDSSYLRSNYRHVEGLYAFLRMMNTSFATRNFLQSNQASNWMHYITIRPRINVAWMRSRVATHVTPLACHCTETQKQIFNGSTNWQLILRFRSIKESKLSHRQFDLIINSSIATLISSRHNTCKISIFRSRKPYSWAVGSRIIMPSREIGKCHIICL